ncbi:LutB/LldF family L-lactate oxidation iron-sulfur protein [soil metagenome]
MTEAYDYSAPFATRARAALADPELGHSVGAAVDRQAAARLRALESLEDPDALRDLAARIRAANLARLDEHLDRLATTWEAAGGTVFFAGDAEEARTYVVAVAKAAGATEAVKSKSMASEEIGLNEALTDAGIEPIETDLGEYIVQLAGEHPSHIVTPAIHKSKSDVAELFSRVAGEPMPEDAVALAAFARARLRQRFLSAGLGVSGVNFGVADAGALCIVSNEGNARMCTSLPRVHVAIMGMERVVWDLDQLAVMLSLLARSATGQKLTQYTSLLHGPRTLAECDGPEESHLVILDNGRSSILGTRYAAALHCIRCGACLNVCPVFRQIGGHAYDPVYSGPIGAVLDPLLRGQERSGDLAHASTLCGACTEVCPVRIPLHDMLLWLRQDHAEARAGIAERSAFRAWAAAWSSPRRFAWSARAAGVLGGSMARRLRLPGLERWTRARHLPARGGEEEMERAAFLERIRARLDGVERWTRARHFPARGGEG